MPKQINIMVILLFLILGLFSFVFSQESMTITTYYPSPYGSYNELTTTGNTYLATTSGKVGIGTTGPQAALDFGSTLGRKVNYYHDGANAGSGVRTASGLIVDQYTPSASEAITWSTYTGTWASPSYTERMRLTTAGKVGIGDASPAALLTVGNGDLFQVISSGEVRTIAGAVGAPAYSFTGDTNTGIYSGGADILRLATGGADRVTVDASGQVGIGTVGPSQKLSVAGTVESTSGGFKFPDGTVQTTGGFSVVNGPSGTACCTQPAITVSCPSGTSIVLAHIHGTCASTTCGSGTSCSTGACDTNQNESWSSFALCR